MLRNQAVAEIAEVCCLPDLLDRAIAVIDSILGVEGW